MRNVSVGEFYVTLLVVALLVAGGVGYVLTLGTGSIYDRILYVLVKSPAGSVALTLVMGGAMLGAGAMLFMLSLANWGIHFARESLALLWGWRHLSSGRQWTDIDEAALTAVNDRISEVYGTSAGAKPTEPAPVTEKPTEPEPKKEDEPEPEPEPKRAVRDQPFTVVVSE